MTDATEQAIDQTMRLVLTGAEYTLKVSGTGAKHLAAGLLSVASTRQKTRGKARLESMLKSGKELKVFNVTTSELATFAREAKRYGVLYALIKGTRENPDDLVDILVKAEDAAKINRIVERLEYGKYDEAGLVVEAERELAGRSGNKDATDKGVQVKDTDELLKELVGGAGKEVTEKNPTVARTESPSPSEPLSDKDGRPQNRISAEKDAPDTADGAANKAPTATERDAGGIAGGITDKDGTARSKTREGRGFEEDGRARASVKKKIEQKRAVRVERREQQLKVPAQTRHQTPPPKRRVPKDKTVKGR